jgi:hypothetical protein
MTFYTSASERMRISTAGVVELTSGQLKFPATQNASADANTLDDYEEGTWTPVGNGVTLTGVIAQYTKIGNTVTIQAQWTYPSNSDGGNAQISGLPFTVAGGGGQNTGNVTITNYGSDNLYVFAGANGTIVFVRNNLNNELSNAVLTGKFVTFAATYRAA